MAPLSAALANGDDTLSITADCYSTAGTDAAIAAALLAYYTSSQVDTLLGDYRTGTAQDAETTGAITAALLAYYTSSQVDALLGDYRRHADAGRHHGRAAGLPDGPRPGRVHHQPNHRAPLVAYRSAADQDTATASSIAAALLSYYTIAQVDGLLAGKLGVTEAASALQIAVRFPDDGGADEVVAAIGEQILGPTDVSLSNWTVRPSSGCSVPGHARRGSERGRLHPDPSGEPVEHRAHLQLDPLYGSFVGDQAAWSTAKMYFTVPPNGAARASRLRACPTKRYGLQILDATLEAGNTAEEDTAASALLLKHEFLDGGADDVTLATLGEVLLEPTLTTLGNFLVRSNSQLRGGRLPAGGLRHDLERLRPHLHADAGETLLFRLLLVPAGHGLQPGDVRQRGRQRLCGRHRHLPRHALAGSLEHGAERNREAALRSLWGPSPGWCSSRRARWTCTACKARRGCCARGRQRARGHVAHRGEVPGVGRVVDGECAAGDSCGGAQQVHAAAVHVVAQQLVAAHCPAQALQVAKPVGPASWPAGPSRRLSLEAARGAQRRHAGHHQGGLHGPAGLREPGLHLHATSGGVSTGTWCAATSSPLFASNTLTVSNTSTPRPPTGPGAALLGNQSARSFWRDGGAPVQAHHDHDEALVQTKSLSTQLFLTTNKGTRLPRDRGQHGNWSATRALRTCPTAGYGNCQDRRG